MAHKTSTARDEATRLPARVHGGYEYGVDTDMHMHMDRPLATKLVSRRPASPGPTLDRAYI